MRNVMIMALVAGFLAAPAVWADEDGPWDFEFTASGGAIPDEGVAVFPLFMNLDYGNVDHVDFIASLELIITDLDHTAPADLDVFLIDPFGTTIEIMTDLGNMSPISGVELVFNDKYADIPGIPLESGNYRPEGLQDGSGGLGEYQSMEGGYNAGGTDAWVLLMIDDAPGDSGSLGSYTLRGTVPEPATLSLLVLGALAVLRRRS